MIFYNEPHGIPHVHVYHAEGAAVVALGDEGTPPRLLEASGLKAGTARRALSVVAENRAAFARRWEEIHGG